MKIKPGAEVIDKNGKVLGSVDLVARNGWSGEIRKFVVNRKPPEKDLFLATEDVLEATNTRIKLKIAFDELSANM